MVHSLQNTPKFPLCSLLNSNLCWMGEESNCLFCPDTGITWNKWASGRSLEKWNLFRHSLPILQRKRPKKAACKNKLPHVLLVATHYYFILHTRLVDKCVLIRVPENTRPFYIYIYIDNRFWLKSWLGDGTYITQLKRELIFHLT